MKTYLLHVALSLLSLVLAAGCTDEPVDVTVADSPQPCTIAQPQGTVHPLRTDDTVDITPDQAWPGRLDEVPALTQEEYAKACVVLVACQLKKEPSSDAPALVDACLDPGSAFFWEERAVPTPGTDSRWSVEARAVLAAGANCDKVLDAARGSDIPYACEEAGCTWTCDGTPLPEVSCEEDIATLTSGDKTYTRDCSLAMEHCDATSPTGCTDRRPTGCEHPAKDRCDGSIRLGCDGTGRVSFHDCSRVPGGTCGETSEGIRCIYPDAGQCTQRALCDGDTLVACPFGEPIEVDCKGMGFAGCKDSHCFAE